jgi:hypothetical protein
MIRLQGHGIQSNQGIGSHIRPQCMKQVMESGEKALGDDATRFQIQEVQ